jgi:LysM repeat protein
LRRSRWWASRWPSSSSSPTRPGTTQESRARRAPQRSAPAQATPTPKSERKKRRKKTYTIKAGDTPSGIAVKVGVPLDQILELNPDLDPQTLTPGTKIKLR